ncbi:hypothetical protein [Bremerella cremea]|uniref:hypothetical protein n=1 Tax=Bremerella cremea TaxID=1031537 RepID=UPI0031E8F534
MDGPLITAWTIRLALIAMASSLVLRMVHPWCPLSEGFRRGIWTAGCALFLAHIAAGMQFYHHWNHQHAYAETARQTYEVLGVRFGGGIYVNHLMAIVWLADTVWWWVAPQAYRRRSPWWERGMIGFFLFIAFNGLVVFKSGGLRIAGILGFVLLAVVWGMTRHWSPAVVPHAKPADR